MRKSKAVSSLKKQINKLDNSENMNHSWCVETRTYLNAYFGENSEQSNNLKKFEWDTINDKEKYKKSTLTYLESCIDTINNIGIKKENHDNWFSKLPTWAINLGLTGLCFISFSTGILLTNNNNSELRQENKEIKEKYKNLRDSLSVRQTFKVSDKISN